MLSIEQHTSVNQANMTSTLLDDPSEDPSNGNNNIGALLDGIKGGTSQLMTGVNLVSPTDRLSPSTISEFDVHKAMGQVAGLAYFPAKADASSAWKPAPQSSTPYQDVKTRWDAPLLGPDAGIDAAKLWREYDAFNWNVGAVSGAKPEILIATLDQVYTEAPTLSNEVTAAMAT